MGVGTGLYMYDVVVKKYTFAISSPGEFLQCSPKMTSRPRELAHCTTLLIDLALRKHLQIVG